MSRCSSFEATVELIGKSGRPLHVSASSARGAARARLARNGLELLQSLTRVGDAGEVGGAQLLHDGAIVGVR